MYTYNDLNKLSKEELQRVKTEELERIHKAENERQQLIFNILTLQGKKDLRRG